MTDESQTIAPMPLDSADTAFKRAVFWLNALIEAADIDPAETTIGLKVHGSDGEVLHAIRCNLADDLAAFAALGAESPDLGGMNVSVVEAEDDDAG